MSEDDSTAWRQAVDGDGRAFAVLFTRHKGRVRRQLRRFLASPFDVDDALAIVFLETWRRRDTVRLVEGSVLPWLLVTATYVANNYRRAARRHQALLAQLPTVDEVSDPAMSAADLDVRGALQRLPLLEQQVLTLCVIEGWPERGAAAVLGVPPGTVKSRLHRAKRRLADQLGVVDPDPSPNTNAKSTGGAKRGH